MSVFWHDFGGILPPLPCLCHAPPTMPTVLPINKVGNRVTMIYLSRNGRVKIVYHYGMAGDGNHAAVRVNQKQPSTYLLGR